MNIDDTARWAHIRRANSLPIGNNSNRTKARIFRGVMDINITDSEREFLVELLETRYRSILHELHHTDTYDYKQLLSHQLDLLEKVRDKLKTAPAQLGQEEKASTS